MENIEGHCKNDEACAVEWNKVQDFNEREGKFKASLTHLDGLEGSVPVATNNEGSIYAAEFMEVDDMHTPYYERMLHETVNVPWLATSGDDMESTYMNRTKALNEPPVRSYKDLKLSSVPQTNYGGVEGFGEGTQNLVFKILCVVFLIMLVYYLMKEIK